MIAFIVIILVGVAVVLTVDHFNTKNKLRELKEQSDRKAQDEREHVALLEKINRQLLLAEVLHQAKLVGDETTSKSVIDNVYDGELPQKHDGFFTSLYPERLMILSIAGINYRGNLKAYVGDFKGVLVPEPKNDYDQNAIMIKCEDGKHLGYIPEDKTQLVRNLINHHDAKNDNEWRHRITGHIDECEQDDEFDDSPRKFFAGYIYIVK